MPRAGLDGQQILQAHVTYRGDSDPLRRKPAAFV
jgi:hypothetical protein